MNKGKWYVKSGDNKPLRYDEPIVAEDKCNGDGMKYLLIPQLGKYNYDIKGFNWFNLTEGRYNSRCCYKTAEAAVGDYSHLHIYNADIILKGG